MPLKTFRGGVHPPYHKELTKDKAIEQASLPPEVVIPLHQHTGAPCQPLVQKGDKVLAGQKIGQADAFISAPIHSSVSGEVKTIEPRPYFAGTLVLSVVIVPDEEQKKMHIDVPKREEELTPGKVRAIVKEAGIVGLGGAAFPTHVKLSPPKEKPIDSVIINGCECEPYLTCDHRNMLEKSEELIDGLKIIMKTVGASKGYFGIEVNKPDALEKIQALVSQEKKIEVVPLETRYPQGSEKHLIKALLGREVPSKGLPMDVGALVQNVGTTIAISEAVRQGKPLVERVLTVTGSAIKNPKNLMAKIGTPVKYLIEECGGFNGTAGKIIFGGPMTGIAQTNLEAPIVKGTSGIVVFSQEEANELEIKPCIRCGRCIEVCPMSLLPNFLGIYGEVGIWEQAERYNVFDCIECGCCAYICPAERPLVQWIKLAKLELQKKK